MLTGFPSGTTFAFPLGSRLTLGGQAFPRYPWALGGKDSHLPLATHACIRTWISSSSLRRSAFSLQSNAPLPTYSRMFRSFGEWL